MLTATHARVPFYRAYDSTSIFALQARAEDRIGAKSLEMPISRRYAERIQGPVPVWQRRKQGASSIFDLI